MNKTTNKNNTNEKCGIVRVYYRGVDYFGHGIPIGPKWHPFLKDWNDRYYELINRNGVIIIGSGNLGSMSEATQFYVRKNSRLSSNKIVKVNKKKFLETVEEFKEKHNGKKYLMFDFRKNCIAFQKYVLRKSKLKEA